MQPRNFTSTLNAITRGERNSHDWPWRGFPEEDEARRKFLVELERVPPRLPCYPDRGALAPTNVLRVVGFQDKADHARVES